MLDSSGSLRIRAFTAGGALPVRDAIVRISGAEESNRLIHYTLETDRDGLTPRVDLATPSVDYSLNSAPSEQPYSLYDVEISAPGFITKKIGGLTIFSGVDSVQLVNMIPNSGDRIQDYPRGSVNTVIPENENLS